MAECYLCNAKMAGDTQDARPVRISNVNTQFSPGKTPLVPFLPMVMREACPSGSKVPELGSTAGRLEKCLYNTYPHCESWQCAYLSKHPNLDPQPTATTAIPDSEQSIPPVTIYKKHITRHELEREIARQRLLSRFGGKFDLKTICQKYGRKKKKPQPKAPPPEPVEEEKPKEKKKPKPKEEPVEEPKEEPKEEVVEEKRPILKNKSPSLDIPRTPSPYLPLVNTGGVDFFPGKPRLTQRYRADEVNMARRRVPIVEEADQQFTLKRTSKDQMAEAKKRLRTPERNT